MKPLIPTKLKQGQAIGAAVGFADTFNWVVDATENIHGDGTYITVNKTIPESPEIELDIDALAGALDSILDDLSSLSTDIISELSDIGGCSCDVSCELSSGTKIASWTHDGWVTQKDIYAPPVYSQPFDFDPAQNKIVNCLWYMGRQIKQLADYSVDTTNSRNYWLKIETDQYGQFRQSTIITAAYSLPVNGGAFSAPANTSSDTHYPLWSIQVNNNQVTPTFDWRSAWKTPFYST